jgi:hypothetical protein
MTFTQSAHYKREMLTRLDLALALALGDQEVIQFNRLERERIEPIKRNTCPDCGVKVAGNSRHCQMHANALQRGRPRKL